MHLLTALHRLESRRPLRNADGSWNVVLWIDFDSLEESHQPSAQHIEEMARVAGIQICNTIGELVDAPAQAIFIVAHHLINKKQMIAQSASKQSQSSLEIEQGTIDQLKALNTQLSGRWLLLNMCGRDEFNPESVALLNATQAHGTLTYHSLITIQAIALVFEQFIALGNQEPNLFPDVALHRAINQVISAKG